MENENPKGEMGSMERCEKCPTQPICQSKEDCIEDMKDETTAGKVNAEMHEKFSPTLKAIGEFVEAKRKEFPDMKFGFVYDIAIIDNEGDYHGFNGINTVGIMKQTAVSDVMRDRQGFLALAVKSLKAARDYFGRSGLPGMPPSGLMAAILGDILSDRKKEAKPEKPN